MPSSPSGALDVYTPVKTNKAASSSTLQITFISPISSRAVTLALFAAFLIACSGHSEAAMNGQLHFFKEANLQSLRSSINASAVDQCYDMPCSTLSPGIASVKWSGLPVTGTAYADGQARIAFYKGANCTGSQALIKTRLGRVRYFSWFEMSNEVSSFAVLETSVVMKHKTVNLCKLLPKHSA